ncbi:MAG: 30S ribosome-binding factor RbfA [Chloroflexi bacterium]|nr:30S ribosome-binding factor RbfA [Chloroflexota bacterium]
MSRRMERVNQLIRDELSQLIPGYLKDSAPGSMVTVTEVVTAADLGSAKVFISVLGDPEEKKAVIDKLSGGASFFRHELASRLYIRKVPELLFRSDESIERGSRLLELLDQVAAEEDGKNTAKK